MLQDTELSRVSRVSHHSGRSQLKIFVVREQSITYLFIGSVAILIVDGLIKFFIRFFSSPNEKNRAIRLIAEVKTNL